MAGPTCRLLAEPMEARILHSADLTPLTWAGASALHGSTLATTANAATAQPSEIAFVDASLPDAQQLIDDLQAQRSAGRPIEVVTIAAGTDGLALIGSTLAGRHDIGAVHVLAHGADGQLQLGATVLDAQTLLRRADEVAAWGHALTGDADLLLYGCDVAETAVGRRLVQDLAALTGADVAASTDLTGAAARGGNWSLEYSTGRIDARLAPSRWEQANWQGVMATYTVTSTADSTGTAQQPGTLRWAITQANANAGTDTIVFAVNGTFNIGPGVSGDDNNVTGDFDIKDSVVIVGNGSANTVIKGNGLDRVFDIRSGTVTMSGLTIQGGASSKGAGLSVNNSAVLSLSDAVVQNNDGIGTGQGAGIYADGSLTLRRVIVQNNGNALLGSTHGAGIYSNGLLDARDVEIRDNDAGARDGGGLYIDNGSNATLVDVTLAGNRADQGGGIYNHQNSTTLTNVTLSGNVASTQGGGVWTDKFISFDHVTVAYNWSLLLSGGGVYDNGLNVSTRNSLFAGNFGGNDSGAVFSLGYNLSDDNSAGFTAVGDQRNTAVALGGLAANGGFTRTHAIGAGSAARDAANPVTALTADQRGVAYYNGRADIGAYEYNPFGTPPTIDGVANQTVDENGTLGPLSFTIGDAETPAANLVVTATSSNTALIPAAGIVLGGSGASRTVTLTPAANANSSNSGGPATITLTVSDGGNSTSTTFAVTVQAVNAPPTIALPPAQSVPQATNLAFSGANAITVSDVDAGTASLQVTLTVANGKLQLSGTGGLSFVVGNGTNDATMTFTGSLSDINAALDGMKYKPANGYRGPDQLDITVNDLGHSGSGGARSTAGSVAITVTAVNQPPVLGLPGAQATPLPTPLLFTGASANAITVSDPDAGGLPLQITLSTANAYGNGRLSFGSLTNLTLVSGTGSNDTTVVLQGGATDLNAALATLKFTATATGSAQIDVALNDLGNSGAGGALQTSGAVAITVGNDALPVLTLGQTSRTFTEGNGQIALDPSLTLSDADNATLASAQVRIGAGYASGEDVLAFVNDGSTMGNIAATFNAGVLSLTSAGQTATVAQWQAALRSVTYANASTAPSTTPRTVTLTVNDGIADSAQQQIALGVIAVNNAPVLTGSNDLAAIAEDASSNGGSLVSTLIAGHISDADNSGKSGIAVTAVDNSQGSWQYTTDGTNWLAFSSVSDSTALLLAADSSTAVRFVPNANWNGTVAGGLRFRAWDQSVGSSGGVENASVNGGSTAFSTTTVASGITVTPVNDPPVQSLQIATASATQGAAFAFALPAGTFTDPDVGDTLSYSATLSAGGALPSWLSFDAATRTFSGTPGNSDVGSFNVRVTATDTSSAAAFGDFTLTVANVNDPPVLAQPMANQSATQGTAFGFTLPAGTFTDPDTGDTLSYGATLSAGGALPSWLSFDAATQTFSGTPANGDVGAISVRVTASDTSNATAFGDFTLTVANVNDPPVLAQPIANQSATQGATFGFIVPAGTFTDPDTGDTLSYSAKLSSGAALPSWLTFDAATRTFSGTPANGDVGAITVRVTAADTSNATAFGDFTLTIGNVNDPPVLAQPFANQSATQGTAFAFTVPNGTFTDPDAGDTLTYGASLASGAALPSWLSFNASTKTFSGTPANADVGALNLVVTATDSVGLTTSGAFALTVANANDAPVASQPIPNQSATQGVAFSFTVPAATFTDPDAGDTLSYSAKLSSGAALPSWLSFDAATRTFSGTPANADVGALNLVVTATDSGGLKASGGFSVTVANVNDAPVLVQPIGDRAVAAGAPTRLVLPSPTFSDPDVGDTLHYVATLADGSALPAWLSFDASTLAFTAAPAADQTGSFVVRVTATDGSGASAQTLFAVVVATPTLTAPAGTTNPDAAPAAPAAAPAAAAPVAPEAAPATLASRGSAPAPSATPVNDALGRSLTIDLASEAPPQRGNLGTAGGTGTRPASRPDAVLAEAIAPEYRSIESGSLVSLLKSDDVLRKLEEIQRQVLEQGLERRTLVASAIAASGGLSVGYVIWLVRGGVLVSSMLSALPAWQMIDPLPVVAGARKARPARSKPEADEGDVERLFDKRRRAGGRPAPASASTASAAAKPSPEETPG